MGHLQVPTGEMKGLESKPLIGRIMKERKEKEWRRKRGERREEKEGGGRKKGEKKEEGFCTDLWEKFREYLIREKIAGDREDAESYMRVFLDRGYDFENLEDDMYNLACFLRAQFEEMFGKELADGLIFDLSVDHHEYKYNTIEVWRWIRVGKYEYRIEVNTFDLRWGVVAESPQEFSQQMLEFLNETKERVVNLLGAMQESRPSGDMKAPATCA
jgi:hypothetical protein